MGKVTRLPRAMALLAISAMLISLIGCGARGGAVEETVVNATEETAAGSAAEESSAAEAAKAVQELELQVFIAASLNKAVSELSKSYEAEHPGVKIVLNADSSGKLLNQILEGYSCDIFFSAAKKQMDKLEKEGLAIEGSRRDVLNNQLVLIRRKENETEVKGLESLNLAKSIAVADGSVPAGRYTRLALQKLEILPEGTEASEITTQELSEALGGVEISEQSNVSKVLTAVIEGSCELGLCYYSDCYSHDELEIVEYVSRELTGDIIYPIALVKNTDADDAEQAAAAEFFEYLSSSDAKEVYKSYYFDAEVG